MKAIYWIAALSLLASTVHAQRIEWKPVTPGNMQWGNAPGRTTYNQIGPTTYGSDGSRTHNAGSVSTDGEVTSQRNGNIVTYSNGNRGVINGNTYQEYDSSGRHVRNCFLFDGKVSCTNF